MNQIQQGEQKAKLMSVKETAELLSISRSTVRRLIRSEKLAGKKIGRQYRLSRDSVLNLLPKGVRVN